MVCAGRKDCMPKSCSLEKSSKIAHSTLTSEFAGTKVSKFSGLSSVQNLDTKLFICPLIGREMNSWYLILSESGKINGSNSPISMAYGGYSFKEFHQTYQCS
jgi:hypothetical protein